MEAHRRRRRRRSILPALLLAALALFLLWVGVRLTEREAEGTRPAESSAVPAVRPPSPAPTSYQPDWNLTLVNPWNALPDGYEPPELKWLPNGLMAVDDRCYDALEAMLNACREAGFTPIVSSAYRAWEEQEQLFAGALQTCLEQGLSEAEARTEAGKVVAVPGTSEHQLGLAVDLCDISNQWLDENQEDTPIQQWLMAHSWEYGFVLRYPSDRSADTGIIYEPWHYRYVGEEDARAMYEKGLCLEEYLEELGADFKREPR